MRLVRKLLVTTAAVALVGACSSAEPVPADPARPDAQQGDLAKLLVPPALSDPSPAATLSPADDPLRHLFATPRPTHS